MRRGRVDRRKRVKKEREREREKVMVLCSFIRPFTPVATATCLEGTPERRRRWQKKKKTTEQAGSLVGAAQTRRKEEEEEDEEQGYTSAHGLLTRRPGSACNEPSFSGRGLQLCEINARLERFFPGCQSHPCPLEKKKATRAYTRRERLMREMKLAVLIKPGLMPNIWN